MNMKQNNNINWLGVVVYLSMFLIFLIEVFILLKILDKIL